MPPDERAATVQENKDLCVLCGERFFVRGVPPLPVLGRESQYNIGLWVEVTRSTFERVYELWDDPGQCSEQPFSVVLANDVPTHVQTVGMEAVLALSGPSTRPKVTLRAVKHSLFDEQSNGINPHKAYEYTRLATERAAPARPDTGSSAIHVYLLFGASEDGTPRREPTHAEKLGGSRYRLLHSPGWTYGIAAGDEFELDEESGRFQVVRRSGFLVVRLFWSERTNPPVDRIDDRIAATLNGRLDGQIEGACVFSIPVSAGFGAIESEMQRIHEEWPEIEWEYGNVYDDLGKPLNWWIASA